MIQKNAMKRKKGPPEPDSAEALKREGLAAVQDLSGGIWTDYNPHDPGVTLLEQLCYALTDLMYRTDFETAELLTGSTGRIDYGKLALYTPEDIFPSQAVTINDYRKILFDALPEIDNVWLRCDGQETGQAANTPEHASQGRYTILVKLDEAREAEGGAAMRREVIEKVKRVYAAHRNLCEDLQDVLIVPPRYYTLHGNIEVETTQGLSELLAELYFECAALVSPGIPFRAFDLALREHALASVFEGPKTEHVHIEDGALDAEPSAVTIADAVAVLGRIPGLRYIERLWFEDEAGAKTDVIPSDPGLASAPCLKIPAHASEAGVRLTQNGRALNVSIQETRAEYLRRAAGRRAMRQARPHLASLIEKPQGGYRNLAEYYSIQHQFPALYGINTYGVPASYPAERQAQAKQLKAYLLPFEQIMANFLQNLQDLPRLFSIDPEVRQSYFSRLLDTKNVPNVEGLYRGSPAQTAAALARLLKQHDNDADRRGRVFDYLLSLYGEAFDPTALGHLEDEGPADLQAREGLRIKRELLKREVELSRMRAAAFNYRERSWNTENTAALKKKAALLLGLRYPHNRSLIDNFIEKGLELLSDDQYKSVKEGTLALEYVDLEDIGERIEQQFLAVPLRPARPPDEGRLFNDIVFMRHNGIGESILRKGIHLERYRVGRSGEGNRFQLVFKAKDEGRWEHLGSFASIEDAVSAANDLRTFLMQLNAASEGFHLIEHLLLEALGTAPHAGVPEDFYPFRMSVLLPDWTARFHDGEFRKLAEDTLRGNAPAHLQLDFYWLSFRRMNAFEMLYKKWLDLKWAAHNDEEDFETLDTASKALIDFLLADEMRPYAAG